MSRIVLFGATGYTGRLTARALVDFGAAPLLLGRRLDALEGIARHLGGLEAAEADAKRPETIAAALEPGDVLVTTVGPMTRWGQGALTAALDARAHYVDSSGESAWVRWVFEQVGPRAERAGIAVLPAMAYDSAPGNLAGALALHEAEGRARRLRIGYFVTGGRGRGLRAGLRQMSGGSRATFARMALEPGFAFRGGSVIGERASARVARFEVDGHVRRGLSFGTSEALSLPRVWPELTDVEAYFGWFDRASRPLQGGAAALAAATVVPPARRALLAGIDRLAGSSGAPPAEPESGSLFVAEAMAGSDRLARVVLAGINGYVFSANMLAWTAAHIAEHGLTRTGTLGPIEAFELDTLRDGVAAAGIARTA